MDEDFDEDFDEEDSSMLSRLTNEKKVFLFFLLAWIFFYFGYWLDNGKIEIQMFNETFSWLSLRAVMDALLNHFLLTFMILLFLVLYYFLLAFLLLLLGFVLIPPLTLINFICQKIFNREFDWGAILFEPVRKCLMLEGFSASTEWRIIFSCLFGAFFVAGISFENSLFWYKGLGDLLPI